MIFISGYRVAAALVAATMAGCLIGCTAPEAKLTPFETVEVVGSIVDGYDCTAPNLVGFLNEPSESDALDAPARMRVPTGFKPVDVYRCNVLPALGEVSAPTADRLDGDLEALLTPLAVPDSDIPDGVSEDGEALCTFSMEYPPELWLVDADGQAIRAQWPSNACGKTLPGSVDILDTFVATRVDASVP
jgi:hypothetical protein